MAYRPTEKTQARKRAQLTLLLNSALAIVSESGFKALTIASLAERAGVATGTIYKYFQNKADLCTHVFRKGSGKEVELVRRTAFPEAVDPDYGSPCSIRLDHTILAFAKRAIAGKRLAYALIAEPVDPLVEAERLAYRRAYAEIFKALLEEGMNAGEFEQADANILATAIVGALAETLVEPLGQSEPSWAEHNHELLIETIRRFCLKAVKTSQPN